jgi:hypothetical protein
MSFVQSFSDLVSDNCLPVPAAPQGARVILACRSSDRCAATARAIQLEADGATRRRRRRLGKDTEMQSHKETPAGEETSSKVEVSPTLMPTLVCLQSCSPRLLTVALRTRPSSRVASASSGRDVQRAECFQYPPWRVQAFEGAELEMEDMRSVREFAETYAQAGMPLNALVRSHKTFSSLSGIYWVLLSVMREEAGYSKGTCTNLGRVGEFVFSGPWTGRWDGLEGVRTLKLDDGGVDEAVRGPRGA